ncbi:phenylalanine--tRNA ligase beta subunit-related protein [Micromonospora sp. WMMD1082]|uniref:B3/B4 domain-containing protein n=1 Tax=Micromonospora sp. WMMD1082 TaxID=3016104 RepID=UPI0024161E36|nr:phenylalanine--tRNA ligase beta subunit-related protein [Micromonospora sp. WMMD1082]MDG4796532.1 phenylalanine--tRNA ligase beta subunit-related protein [Micromonospora sp. WMMD1082]
MTQPRDGADALTVRIDDRVLTAVPAYVLGLIAVPAVQVAPADPTTASLLSTAEEALHRAGLDRAGVAEVPQIAAWRAAYQAVGVNPNRFPCAAESIARRVARGDRLPRINALVDLCNAISLGTALPVASCSVAGLTAIAVRPADGSETYLPLGAPDAPERPEPGEVIYADADGRAHSRRWNWRQGHLVRTEPGRHRLLLTVETAHPDGRADVEIAMSLLLPALEKLVGRPHTTRSAILDAGTTSAVFTTGPTGDEFSASPAGNHGGVRR